MNNEQKNACAPAQEKTLPRFLDWAVEKILPRAIRHDTIGDLRETYRSLAQFMPHSAVMVAGGYRIQAISAFNGLAFVAEIAAIIYCFAAASLPLPLLIVLGAILSALTLRDAYTHPACGSMADSSSEPIEEPPPLYLDTAGDAATAAVFLLASQTLMLQISPSLAMPRDFLVRGALVCLPLLATLRMILRPSPNNGMSFEGPNWTAAQMYKRTQRLNILWAAASCATISTNGDALAVPVPGRDFLITFIPIATIGLWFRLQQNALSRDSGIETVFMDWKKKDLARKKETLMNGVEKQDPLYAGYVGLEALFFLLMTLPSAMGLWPWLAGRAADVDFFRLGFNLGILVTLALTWNYVKNSNRTAIRALQKEIG